jgi:hypothetical protein
VNTYDPADRVIYVHMARESDPYAIPVTSTRTGNRLPVGYANSSHSTCLSGCNRWMTDST